MHWLSEDPTILGGGLVALAVGSLIALRLTQQGRYLAWALLALGLAMALAVVEHFWVTDNERIERVVYDLQAAVLTSDAERVLSHLTRDVQFVHGGNMTSGETTRDLIRTNLANTSFDFLRVQDLQVSAGQRTRRGKAEFRVYAKGTMTTSLATMNVGTANSNWSLGFQETEPQVWKVNRITPVSIPEGALIRPNPTINAPRFDGPPRDSSGNPRGNMFRTPGQGRRGMGP